MAQNSVAFIAGNVIRSGGGFLAWLIAARLFPAAELGIAAAAVSAMILCAQVSVLGTDVSLVGLLPRHRSEPAKLLHTAYTLVVLTALATGLGFLALCFVALPNLRVIATEPAFALAFLGLCALAALWTLLDQTSVALRRGDHVMLRGIAVVSVTLTGIALAPTVLARSDAATLILVWFVAFLTASTLGVTQLRASSIRYLPRPHLRRTTVSALVRLGLPNFVLTTADRASGLVLPILAAQILSAEANAHWYTVQMMATALLIIPQAVGLVMYAEVSDDPKSLQRRLTQGLRLALLLAAGAAALLALVGPFLLGLLGGDYRVEGATALRVLLLSVFPSIAMQAYYTACRATNRLGEAITASVLSAIATISVACAGAVWLGILGIALGWLVALCVVGSVAALRLNRIRRAAAAGATG